MGLFFNRKKKKKIEEEQKRMESFSAGSGKVYLEDPIVAPDMVSLIKKEQIDEMLNPFNSAPGELLTNKNASSVAKYYGTKYASVKGRQLASSKVVDVRSYVKPEEKEEPQERTELEKELDRIEAEKNLAPKKASFFDELMKSLEEDEDDKALEEELRESNPEPAPTKLPPRKVEKKSAEAKKPTKKKKSVDIDIISGDFGGTDIM